MKARFKLNKKTITAILNPPRSAKKKCGANAKKEPLKYYFYQKKILFFFEICMRDCSGKPTEDCSDSGRLRGLGTESPTLLLSYLEYLG
jgi:hypothetical protein